MFQDHYAHVSITCDNSSHAHNHIMFHGLTYKGPDHGRYFPASNNMVGDNAKKELAQQEKRINFYYPGISDDLYHYGERADTFQLNREVFNKLQRSDDYSY